MVMDISFKYLNRIKFSNLNNWSVSHLLEETFSYNKAFPLVKVGKFLIKNNVQTIIENDKIYKRITVKINNNGVVLRDTEQGNKIGTKRQFLVKEGQFIISKIDARNGAMGIIPKDLDGAIVTNDFPTFNIDSESILPQFLLLITTTRRFIEFAQSCSSGTTNRQRIDLKKFLDVQIPLPPLNDVDAKRRKLPNEITQERLVQAYNNDIQLAQEAQIKVLKKEIEIEEFLASELGVNKIHESDVKKGLTFIQFKKLNRWDAEYFLQDKYKLKSNYPLISYAELFKNLYNGIPARNYSKEGIRFLKVADVKKNELIKEDFKYINQYKDGDLITSNTLLITRKGTVGNSFFVKEDKKYTASSEIFIIKLNENIVDGNYLSEINLSAFVQKQYKEKNTGTIMPSISQNKLKEIKIPLPDDLNKQREIASIVTDIRNKISQLKEIAVSKELSAIDNFENALFSTKLAI